MPAVTINLGRCSPGTLPHVCMECGRPGDQFVPHKFRSVARGGYAIAATGLLVTNRVTISVPFCKRHRSHWAWRNRLFVVPIIPIVLLGIGARFYYERFPPERPDHLDNPALFVFIGAIVAWLLVAGVTERSGIRAVEMTGRTITLTRVHQDFKAALLANVEPNRSESETRRKRSHLENEEVRDDDVRRGQ